MKAQTNYRLNPDVGKLFGESSTIIWSIAINRDCEMVVRHSLTLWKKRMADKRTKCIATAERIEKESESDFIPVRASHLSLFFAAHFPAKSSEQWSNSLNFAHYLALLTGKWRNWEQNNSGLLPGYSTQDGEVNMWNWRRLTGYMGIREREVSRIPRTIPWASQKIDFVKSTLVRDMSHAVKKKPMQQLKMLKLN